ncbi:deoxyribodipyrimidine photo-lyase family protein (cryptochrome) [Roseibium hamelinense]|uniref:Deoxyribodipyrimidine photo-lyase family protein (Cryptochrome) n=1 Tax=Roseibium hamelinense TaxID=150831 RepID=A0A562T156_9HYPH|nr:deoxyribodipyrimidine photo-lyase [Roseibium hamelinense]MTI44725.1 deoxyribodipyrimidine photo-lyase [Roseibium hamelinense]TWI87355.1 deoxyribodipyrimidine photo-lyase family protein (cryptochrome) [Roseibium hamelinense]
MPETSKIQVVWYKRDLRVVDHAPLALAARRGPVIPLYVFEPDLWAEPDASGRHFNFLKECLTSLLEDLGSLGQPLIIRTGEIRQVLKEFHDEFGIEALWSHEETGNNWTYQRDLRVNAWCRERGVAWHEIPQFGVVRRLTSRDGWAKRWDSFMAQPAHQAPQLEPVAGIDLGCAPNATSIAVSHDHCPHRQRGGRAEAEVTLHSFFYERGKPYQAGMATPVFAFDACSRISPYLSFGSLSMREVAQATWARQRELKQTSNAGKTKWRAAMRSFSGRLHWHCHFMQKLEDEPRLEYENLHHAYDDLRPSEPDQTRLNAWKQGETGLPFVDACMRALSATGWMNFRMRAMLVAVSSYHLWLDWRQPGLHLARLFTDYEPGIHWSQIQMQSGTTGINTVRIYNPVKQGKDQDPEGEFVRKWVPELSDIEMRYLHEPWKADNAGRILGKSYPFPIVDHLTAAKEAREKVWGVRKGRTFREGANSIQKKHGSRKSGIPMRGQERGSSRAKSSDTAQTDLFGSNS